MSKRWCLAIFLSVALSQVSFSQTGDFEKYLKDHGILSEILNIPARVEHAGNVPDIKPVHTGKPERTEKVKLLLPGAKAPQELTVVIRDGLVFLADDILLFTEAEFELKKQEKGSIITYSYARWTGGKIPYVLPITHPMYIEILDAIGHINQRTNICLVPRTNETEYVEFIDVDTALCYSQVGRTGGRQVININNCGRGEIIHEIGHTAGLFHEHTRSDRDDYVNIHFENIRSGAEINFTRIDSTAADIGAYDYNSIMHYGDTAFTRNDLPTIEIRIPPATLSTQIGQRDSLSTGDVAALNSMYPTKICGANPVGAYIALGLPVVVNPVPIKVGENFTITTNVINLGNQIFKGCYYAAIFDSTSQLVRMLTPIEETSGLGPGSTYLSTFTFQGGTLYTLPGQYYIAMYYRDNCTGEFKTMGSDFYPSLIPIQLQASVPLVLSVSPQSLTFGNQGGAQAIQLTSNVTWSVTGTPSWCTLTPSSGKDNGTLLLTCQPNNNLNPRTGTLAVQGTGGVQSKFISITQEGTKPPVVVSPTSINVPSASGATSIIVEATVAWTAYENSTWLSLDPSSGVNNGIISVFYQQNKTFSPRTGYIYVLGSSGAVQTIIISQAAGTPYLTISSNTLNFTAQGGSANLAISSNVNWAISETLDWLSVNLVSGTGDGSIILTCQSNPLNLVRTGTVRFSGLNVSPQTLTVTQAGSIIYISVLPGSLDFPEEGGDQGFSVFSSLNWTATTTADWLYLNPVFGAGNGSVDVQCTPNFSASSRSATINVVATGGYTTSITVTQAGAIPVLNVSEETLSFTGTGGTAIFELASNTTWRVSESVTWLSVAPVSGKDDATITVTCTPRSGSFTRSTTITVYATGAPSQRITVTQIGSNATLSVFPIALSVGAAAGTGNIAITSNTSWSITETADWLSVAPATGSNNGISVVSYTQNTSQQFRTATLTVSAPGVAPTTVTITQDGASPMLSVLPTTINFQEEGGNNSISIASNINWIASSSAPWVTLSTSSGSNSGAVTVFCTPNPGGARTAFVTISGSGVSNQVVTITQDASAPTLIVSPASLDFNSPGGTATVSISATTSWTVSESLSWISVSPTSGSNDGTLTVTCQENTSTTDRTGIITISGVGVSAQQVTITQQAAASSISVSPTVLDFTSTGGNATFTIASNISWSVVESVNWLSVSPESGSNAGTITVVCTANTTLTPRSTTIIISGAGAETKTVTINQAGNTPSLVVSPTTVAFTSAAGTSSFAITSNITWNISESLSWIQLSALAGVNDGTIQITCLENTDPSPRTGTITVSGPGVTSQTITVTQAGAVAGPPEAWDFTITENNHTVILSESLTSNLGGATLQIGDYVGIFFTANDQEFCGGNTIWTGTATSIPVYGDDASTLPKDGFDVGESFIVKVWRAVTQEELTVFATYAPADTLITANGKYVVDGVSMITGLNTAVLETMKIPLAAGWNTVSSYIIPEKGLLDTLLASYPTIIRTVEDDSLKVFTFEPPVNQIGSWSITEGYRIEALVADTLRILGQPVDPEANPIPFAVGWQIIPFFGRTQQLIAQALLSIRDKIDVVKDNTGRTYIPGLGINSIGKMKPGQGYRLKAKAEGTLVYPVGYMAKAGAVPFQPEVPTSIFRLPENHITRSNATLVFIADNLTDILAPGDEIGVFTPDNHLVGAGKFTGSNFAIAVWGEDTGRPGRQGLLDGEGYHLRVWKQAENQVFNLRAVVEAGQERYLEDEVILIQYGQLTAYVPEATATSLRIFPNPTNAQLQIYTPVDMNGTVHIRLLDLTGKVLMHRQRITGFPMNTPEVLDLSGYPEGIYLVQVQDGSRIWSEKIAVVK